MGQTGTSSTTSTSSRITPSAPPGTNQPPPRFHDQATPRYRLRELRPRRRRRAFDPLIGGIAERGVLRAGTFDVVDRWASARHVAMLAARVGGATATNDLVRDAATSVSRTSWR